jgi:hypothetical protein
MKKDMKKDKKRKLKFVEIKDSFGFYIFDKIIIATIAAIFLIVFQSLAHKYQQILDIRLSTAKMYTDIMIKYRENTINTMNNYIGLVDGVKQKGRISDEERGKITDCSDKIKIYQNFMCVMTPKDTKCVFDKEAEELISDMSDLNSKLILGHFSAMGISNDINNLQLKYLLYLEKHRRTTMEMVEKELAEYAKYNFWDNISNYFKSIVHLQQK